jgi:hypothetical protein
MTTQTQPRTQPRRQLTPARITAIVVGGLLAAVGVLSTVAGGAGLAVFGSDGSATSGRHSLSTASSALVSSVAEIEDANDFADALGDPSVRLSVEADGSSSGVFVGIGLAADVDRYLASAPIEEATDFELDPFRFDRRVRPGSSRPAAPASQRFWVAKGSGRDAASLRWRVRDGDYRAVVMNADGSRGVDTDGRIGLTVPHLPELAWGLIGGGLLLMAGGIAAGALAARRPR